MSSSTSTAAHTRLDLHARRPCSTALTGERPLLESHERACSTELGRHRPMRRVASRWRATRPLRSRAGLVAAVRDRRHYAGPLPARRRKGLGTEPDRAKGKASAAPIDAPSISGAAPTLIGHELRDFAGHELPRMIDSRQDGEQALGRSSLRRGCRKLRDGRSVDVWRSQWRSTPAGSHRPAAARRRCSMLVPEDFLEMPGRHRPGPSRRVTRPVRILSRRALGMHVHRHPKGVRAGASRERWRPSWARSARRR